MAALANNTLASPGTSFYALAGESARNWYTFPALNGTVLLADAAGIQTLQAIGNDLFYNDELLAKASDIQDIAAWSDYPAINNVNMDGFSLVDVSGLTVNNGATMGTLLVSSGITSEANITTPSIQVAGAAIPALGQITTLTLAASGQIQAGSVSSTGAISGTTISGTAVSGTSLATTGGLDMTNSAITRASSVGISNAGAAPYGALTSPDGVMLTWNGQSITTGAAGNVSQWANYPAVANVNMNSNNITNAFSVISQTAEIGTIGVGAVNSGKFVIMNNNSITGSTTDGLTVASYTGQPLALTSGTTMDMTVGTSATVTTTNDFSVTCDGGLNPLVTPAVNLTAQNGNGGQINLTADPGSIAAFGGTINIKANGGQIILPTDPPTTVTVGGLIELDANTGTPGGVYTATSAIKMNAAGINSYAGAIPSVGSLAGYNFIYGSAGVSLCAGLPSSGFQLPFTTYIYGLGTAGFTGVRLQSPNGIGLLSDTYATNLYPFDGTDLTIQGRSAPSANVVIKDCANLTMTSSGNVTTDFVNSLSGLGIFYKDNFYPQTNSQGIYANFLKPAIASAPGVPNLVISNNPFGGNTNYVEISGATAIAFDPTGAGALSGVQSINGAAWPPPTGDASLWSQYPATSIIDVSGYGLKNVGDISGVVSINGEPYAPASAADWSLYPAVQNVDISGFDLSNVNSMTMPANGLIVAAGQLSIFSDVGGNLNLASNGGGDVNIGTGNAGDINITTGNTGNNVVIGADKVTLNATVSVEVNSTLDMVANEIINVSTLTADIVQGETNLLLRADGTGDLTLSTAAGVVNVLSPGIGIVINSGATGNTTIDANNIILTPDNEVQILGAVAVGTPAAPQTITVEGSVTTTGDVTSSFGTDNYSLNTIGALVGGIPSGFRDATEFYVSFDGSDNGLGSILSPFQTIQKAITQAELVSSAAQVCNINVASGHYTENLVFNKGYVVLSGTLQAQTGNEVCEITGSITINCVGANDVFNRQVAFQGFNISCGVGQSITNTSTSSHTVSFQDCKIFVNSVCYNSTASCADARTYFTNVEVFSTNAANVSPVITTNVGLVELERMDVTVDGNAIGILIGGTSVLSRFSLSTLENTNTATTLLPLLSFTSTSTSAHSLGNVAFAFTSAVAKTATNAVYINSGINTAIIMLNNVFTLTGTSSSTNNCIGYNGVGSPTIAGINNTSLNVNVLLPQTTSVQSGITQIAYTDINPSVLASYSSSLDQAIVSGSVPQALTLNTTNFNSGTVLSGNSIFVASQGNYAINFAVQLQNTSASVVASAFVFLKKNGTAAGNNVANSSCFTTVPVNTGSVAISPQIILQLNAGDFIQLWISAPTVVNVNAAGASATVPASPSVIVNITQIR
jgi:hypothetical protein